MSQRLNNLTDIIGTLKSGSQFYRRAARQSGDTEHEKAFLEHATQREEAVRELSHIVEEAGGEVPDGALMEDVMSMSTRFSAALSDQEEALTKGLEEAEARTLASLREAADHPDNARDEAVLKDLIGRFEDSHARMRALRRDAAGDGTAG